MDAFRSVYDSIYTYFIDPIQSGTGYNLVNTPVLALLFLFLVDATQNAIKSLNISMDKFLRSFMPYMILGGVMRVLADVGVYQGPLFVTPGIYLLMLALTFIDACFGLPVGWLLLAANLTAVAFKTDALFIVLSFAVPLSMASALLFRAGGVKMDYLVLLAVFAHMLDASSTFIAIDFFACGEQHVVANFFMGWAGTAAVMFPLKLVALAVIIYFFRDIKDPQTKAYLYWVVAAVGIGPGIRNTLMATAGLCSGH